MVDETRSGVGAGHDEPLGRRNVPLRLVVVSAKNQLVAAGAPKLRGGERVRQTDIVELPAPDRFTGITSRAAVNDANVRICNKDARRYPNPA